MIDAWLSESLMTASVSVEQGLEEAAVGVEAGAVQHGVVEPEEARELGLELPVDVLRAADEAHARHAEAALGRGSPLPPR